jgi:hypothetical protein
VGQTPGHCPGLAFTELANGFASCDDPAALQAIWDRLGPADIQRFFDRWLARIPTPLGLADQAAGYGGSCRCARSRCPAPWSWTPPPARAFFEALVADNLDLGRPDQVKLIFGRRIRKDTPGSFATKVVTRGVEVAVNVFYQHSRIKQDLKEGRALRVETVVNSPTDLGCQRRLRNLGELQAKARAANRRLLTIQRVGQGCAIETALLARISQPLLQEGQRTGALRLGILASWPWPAPCASCSTPSSASPTGASAPR